MPTGLRRYDQASNHEDVDCAKDIAVDAKGTRLIGCEDYGVSIAGGQYYTGLQVGRDREAVGLSLVLTTD